MKNMEKCLCLQPCKNDNQIQITPGTQNKSTWREKNSSDLLSWRELNINNIDLSIKDNYMNICIR